MIVYQFNTQNHLRIWFSGRKDLFLNQRNQLRMIRFRYLNPRAKMTLVYSSLMLTVEAEKNLKKFCEKHRFTPLDFDTELLSLLKNSDNEDKEIYALAKSELDAFIAKKGGNLGAASDLTRLIALLLNKGTYSDFDTTIQVNKLEDIVTIEKPLLLNSGSINFLFINFFPVEQLVIANDLIGISTIGDQINPDALEYIRLVQRTVISTYKDGAFKTLSLRSQSVSDHKGSLTSYFNSRFFVKLSIKYPNISITDFRLLMDKSTRNIFSACRLMINNNWEVLIDKLEESLLSKLIAALENDNNEDFPDNFSETEVNLIKTKYLEISKSNLSGVIKELQEIKAAYVKEHVDLYSTINTQVDHERNYQRLSSLSTSMRSILLRDSVTEFSGPGIFANALFSEMPITSSKQFSFLYNKLANNFKSGQTIPFNLSKEVFIALNTNKRGISCDLGWVDSGQEEMKVYDEDIDKHSKKCTNIYRTYKFFKNKQKTSVVTPNSNNQDQVVPQ